MTEPVDIDQPGFCAEVVVRTITPVFRQCIDGAIRFTHSSSYKAAQFNIELRPFVTGPEAFAEITRHATDAVRQALTSIHWSDRFSGVADHFLVVDLEYARGIVPETAANTEESWEVPMAALEALRLHSSAGLTYQDTYCFRPPPRVMVVS